MIATDYIVIKFKSVYGRTLVYPVNRTAKTFAAMVHQTTLTADNLTCIERLGFTVINERGGRADWKAERVE